MKCTGNPAKLASMKRRLADFDIELIGLYFDNVPDEDQPGVHVRTVNGKYLR